MSTKKYSEIFKVNLHDCISDIDNSLPNLLGTYTLVKWMEIVCARNINKQIEANYISVGQKISNEHSEMVKLNEEVKIISTIFKEDKRKISFNVEAISNKVTIATATHERVIIPKKIISRLLKNNSK